MRANWGALQRAGAVALVALSCAAAGARCALSDRIPFLVADEEPGWWMADLPVSADLMQWGRERVPVTRYARRVELAAPPDRATLLVRALGAWRVRVDGETAPGGQSDGSRWRRLHELELAPLLRQGAHEIAIEVENAHGPALVSFELLGLGAPLGPADFDVSQDGRALGRPIPADDTRRDAASLHVETPAEAIARAAPALLALFAVGAAGFAVARRRLDARALAALPGIALAVACLAWAWLYTAKIVRIPLFVGFDARHHMAYVDFVRERHAIPLASDGWSMFHPPLFYALAACVSPLGASALRVLPWISGLGLVFVAHSLASRLRPGDGRVGMLAVLFTAALPVGLYSAAYFTNETFHALLAGVALVAGVDALLAPRTSAAQSAWLGLWLGLASLAKFTALALAPVALFFLACKLAAIERARAARALGLPLLAAGVWLTLCGWYYARNWMVFGTPVAANWGDLSSGMVWWQQPGFHTAAWYLRFGESLSHPYLAGFRSFWDGVYSTFWGDGGVGGRVDPAQRHGFWQYDYVSSAYLLGLVATALLAAGAWLSLRRAFRDPDPRARAALSFLLCACYAVGFSLLALTASLPYFAQAKGSYALCLAPALALFFADAAARLDDTLAARGAAIARAAFAGLLTALLGGFFLGYAA
ncbi:MAG TPA: hypothetical protein VMW19_01535 [Myxococcota bacterium]|nr:hypothetical protein [Myxococcota bacterium]